MNRRPGSWEQGRVGSQRRESDPLGAFIRQKRQPLGNIEDHPSNIRQPSVNPDEWPVDLLISCVVAASVKGCLFPKDLAQRGPDDRPDDTIRKSRQPVRTLGAIGDSPSADPSVAVR